MDDGEHDPRRMPRTRGALVRWVRVWEQAGEELDALRADRLHRMGEARMRREIEAIFGILPVVTGCRASSMSS